MIRSLSDALKLFDDLDTNAPLYVVKPIPCKFCPRRFDSEQALESHVGQKRRNKCIRHGLEPRR